MTLPNMLVADQHDNLIEIPRIKSMGINLAKPLVFQPQHLRPLADSGRLVTLKNRVAIGYDPSIKKTVQLREWGGSPVFPVAADLSAPEISLLRCAYSSVLDAPRLPNHSHTAVGITGGEVVVAAGKLPGTFFPGDTLVKHASVHAGASNRVAEILDPAAKKRIVVSLKTLEQSTNNEFLKLLVSARPHSDRIILHVDAAVPNRDIFVDWCKSGLKSVLLTLNAAQSSAFDALNALSNLTFHAFKSVLKLARRFAVNIILDYQVFPGFTDHPNEINALKGLVSEFGVHRLQLTNLGVDPEWYIDELKLLDLSRAQIGMAQWLKILGEWPVQLGYLNVAE